MGSAARMTQLIGSPRRSDGRLQSVEEELAISEEKWGVKTVDGQSRDLLTFGVALDVVVALSAVDAAQNGAVGAPGPTNKIADGQGDGDRDARQHSENRHATRAASDRRSSDFLTFHNQRRVLKSNSPRAAAMTIAARAEAGRSCSNPWASDQEDQNGDGPDDPGELCSRTAGLGDDRASRRRAHRKALKEARCQVGRSERHQLLILVDADASLGTQATRKR